MNALELAIKDALASLGSSKEANKAYLEFIKANFIVPVRKNSAQQEPEVLYQQDDQLHFFLPVFSSELYFDAWVQELSELVDLLKLSGVDLLKGLGANVYLCLNPGSALYKEFNPNELARMQNMILKIFK